MERFGKWNVERVLNEDRSVFACSNDAGQPAVVKIPRRASLSIARRNEEENREVLAYEARQLSAWRGIPGVVQLIEWAPSARTPYLVMELLGASLEDAIPDAGFDAAECFALMRDLATTLEQIHGLRSAHCDLKPDNILRTPLGGWALIDPSPAELATEDYGPSRVLGPPRDLIALGRVFITVYTGAMDTELPDDYIESVQELSGGDRWLKTLRKLLRGDSSATEARRSASAVLRDL